jgi:hypothetical protein
MRVVNNIHRKRVKAVPYGDTVRRENSSALFMVVDFFVGDGNVRIVDLANGRITKIPEDEQVVLVEHTYVDYDSPI